MFVKEVQLEKEQPVQSVTTSTGTMTPGDVLQQLVVALERCCKELKTLASSNTWRKRTQTGRSNIVCWKCKQSGHRRAECLQQESESTQQESESKASQLGNMK